MAKQNSVSLSVVVALAKKFAIEYGALGISSITAVEPNGIKFTLTDGSEDIIYLTFDASGVTFDNSGTTITATTVQGALKELFESMGNKTSVIWRVW